MLHVLRNFVHARLVRSKETSVDPAIELLRALWALDHALLSHSKRMKADMGVTGPQRLVIRMVALSPGISPSELARWLHFHKSTVTIILRSLERGKLVKRTKSPIDGRSITLRLTPKGARIARLTRGTVESVVREVLSRTAGSEVAAARRVLEAISNAFG